MTLTKRMLAVTAKCMLLLGLLGGASPVVAEEGYPLWLRYHSTPVSRATRVDHGRLALRQEEAQWWRDASIAYWNSLTHLPLPAGHAPPRPLFHNQDLKFPFAPGRD